MGTAKRERQKANRAQRRAEDAKAERTSAVRRTALQWGLGIVAAFAAVLLIAWLTGYFNNDDTVQSTETANTEAVATAVTAALDPATTEPLTSEADTSQAEADTSQAAVTDGTPAPCPEADGSSEKTMQFGAAPEMCIDPAKSYTAEIVTNKGTLTVDLNTAKAPNTVNNFVVLSRYHYYDGTDCHRIIPGFMAQCGDPTGTGGGDPGYKFADELPEAGEYQIGSLAMANAGPNTQGSQFFIITGDQGVKLPPDYTLFGQVTGGLDDTLTALDAAGNPDRSTNGMPPLEQVTIESVTITES